MQDFSFFLRSLKFRPPKFIFLCIDLQTFSGNSANIRDYMYKGQLGNQNLQKIYCCVGRNTWRVCRRCSNVRSSHQEGMFKSLQMHTRCRLNVILRQKIFWNAWWSFADLVFYPCHVVNYRHYAYIRELILNIVLSSHPSNYLYK